MSKNVIKDLMNIRDHLALIIINFFVIKSLNIFSVKTLITFRTANIYLMLKEIFERR